MEIHTKYQMLTKFQHQRILLLGTFVFFKFPNGKRNPPRPLLFAHSNKPLNEKLELKMISIHQKVSIQEYKVTKLHYMQMIFAFCLKCKNSLHDVVKIKKKTCFSGDNIRPRWMRHASWLRQLYLNTRCILIIVLGIQKRFPKRVRLN